ncbi:helix-turn-helix domain-containing protein [Klebsiella michiganensis]|uniref:helix-turn-helix domain-containing protein n=1 Tax=Klebsiella michiganensis TaxID=1134687 RepID=UPI0039775B7D
MSRAAEKNLRSLQRENPGAALVFSVLREHMQIGTNAVTISNPALAKILGKSPRTIARATKHLVEPCFCPSDQKLEIQTAMWQRASGVCRVTRATKSGCSHTTVVAHECEQDEGGLR